MFTFRTDVNNPGAVRVITGTSYIGSNTHVHVQTFTASSVSIAIKESLLHTLE